MKTIILDTETTGIDGEIIEVANMELEFVDGKISHNSFYQERFKPSVPIEFGAMAVHNIIEEDLVDCRSNKEYEFPSDVEYLIGHNIDFDWKMLGQPEVKRIDTLALARHYYPELNSHNQSALMYAFMPDKNKARLQLKESHNALTDIQNCLYVLNHMNKDKISANSFEELYEKSEIARIPTVMPFGKHKGMPIKDVPSDYAGWLLRQSDVDEYLIKAFRQNMRK